MSKNIPLIAALALLSVGGSTALWWKLQAPTEPTPDEALTAAAGDEDTGMTRFETEELMRTIGYTQ